MLLPKSQTVDGSFDQFVDKQKRGGACLGEGEFTLDLIAARAKLGRHQLSESWAYILKLVQWAVASNPKEIRIEVRRRFVSVSHDGESIDLAELKDALPRSDKMSVQHLSSALSAVSELKPRRLVLRSATDYVVLAGDSGKTVGDLSEEVYLSHLSRRFTSRLLATTGRVEVIEAAERPQATAPGFTFRGQPFRSAWAVYLRYPLGYALGEGRILWLLDGVVITHHTWKELPHSHIVFADAEGLHTDISGFQLIEDEAYAERMKWLRHWLPEA